MSLKPRVEIILLVIIPTQQNELVETRIRIENDCDYIEQGLCVDARKVFEDLRVRHELHDIMHVTPPFGLLYRTIRVFLPVHKEINQPKQPVTQVYFGFLVSH